MRVLTWLYACLLLLGKLILFSVKVLMWLIKFAFANPLLSALLLAAFLLWVSWMGKGDGDSWLDAFDATLARPISFVLDAPLQGFFDWIGWLFTSFFQNGYWPAITLVIILTIAIIHAIAKGSKKD